MANEPIHFSSASASSVVKTEKSGHQAAQLLSDAASASTQIETAELHASREIISGQQENTEVKDTTEAGEQTAGTGKVGAKIAGNQPGVKGWAVSFSVDNDSNKTVIRVVDAETEKYPSDPK